MWHNQITQSPHNTENGLTTQHGIKKQHLTSTELSNEEDLQQKHHLRIVSGESVACVAGWGEGESGGGPNLLFTSSQQSHLIPAIQNGLLAYSDMQTKTDTFKTGRRAHIVDPREKASGSQPAHWGSDLPWQTRFKFQDGWPALGLKGSSFLSLFQMVGPWL